MPLRPDQIKIPEEGFNNQKQPMKNVRHLELESDDGAKGWILSVQNTGETLLTPTDAEDNPSGPGVVLLNALGKVSFNALGNVGASEVGKVLAINSAGNIILQQNTSVAPIVTAEKITQYETAIQEHADFNFLFADVFEVDGSLTKSGSASSYSTGQHSYELNTIMETGNMLPSGLFDKFLMIVDADDDVVSGNPPTVEYKTSAGGSYVPFNLEQIIEPPVFGELYIRMTWPVPLSNPTPGQFRSFGILFNGALI
jgi:hypothetical protein